MKSINYLIAACAHRVGKRDQLFPGREVLRVHMAMLAKTRTQDLAKITIVRSLPLERDANYAADTNYYWNGWPVDLRNFKCPVDVVDVKDYCFSYSSWAQVIGARRTKFDYYVLIEDDYYPAKPDFAQILVAEHERKLPAGGFLCGFASDHAASSNGIVDSATFVGSLDRMSPEDAVKVSQLEFGRVFCEDRLDDYTDKYRCLQGAGSMINELVHTDRDSVPLYTTSEDLIRPVEYLITGERDFPKSRSSYRRAA